jgi:SAM-dependent methyltransferase
VRAAARELSRDFGQDGGVEVDQDHIRSILGAKHSYYGTGAPELRDDGWRNPAAGDLIGSLLRPDMCVLDVGCGAGGTLLEHAALFASGVGIDCNRDHLALAEAARAERGVDSVSFVHLDVADLPRQGWEGRFDLVFSERGPVGYDSCSVQAALSVLRVGGFLFCEVIGELHHQEVREIFDSRPRMNQVIGVADQVRVAMERNGLGVRLAADLVSKRLYASVYDWLQFQCSIWAWVGMPFPAANDPRYRLFVERNRRASGQIETTHHVVWVGGVKLAEPPPYGETVHLPLA